MTKPSQHFTSVSSFKIHSLTLKSTEVVTIIIRKWGNWTTENLLSFPKATQWQGWDSNTSSLASECMYLNTTLYWLSSFKWNVYSGVWKPLFIFMDPIHIQIMKRTRMDWKFKINGCYFTVSEPNSNSNTRSHWPVSNKNRIQNKA